MQAYSAPGTGIVPVCIISGRACPEAVCVVWFAYIGARVISLPLSVYLILFTFSMRFSTSRMSLYL